MASTYAMPLSFILLILKLDISKIISCVFSWIHCTNEKSNLSNLFQCLPYSYVNRKRKTGCVDKLIQFSTFYYEMESSCHLRNKETNKTLEMC